LWELLPSVADLISDGFLYSQGVMVDLNSLVDSSGIGISVSEAFGIDDNGYIAADATLEMAQSMPCSSRLTFLTNRRRTPLPWRLLFGSLSSLFSIDGTYLEVLTGPTLNPQEPRCL